MLDSRIPDHVVPAFERYVAHDFLSIVFSKESRPQNRSSWAMRCSSDCSGLACSVKALSPPASTSVRQR